MAKNRMIKLLLKFSERKTEARYKIFSVLSGGIFFLVITPVIFILAGRMAEKYIIINWPSLLSSLVIAISAPFGLFFLTWAIISLWKIGKGTPVPLVPTQKIVIVGPYKLCRNPIELGLIFYYLGIGTFFASLTTGFIGFFLFLIMGSTYHKFMEEKELELRFGDEYRDYKKKTPFLIPKIWK